MKYLYLILTSIILLSQPALANDKFSMQTLKFISEVKDGFSIKPYDSYKHTKTDASFCRPFYIDYNAKKLTFKGEGVDSSYDIITEDIHARLIGKWFDSFDEEDVSRSAFITRNEHDYDYDFLEVNHTKKTYLRELEGENKTDYFLLNDFIVVDVLEYSNYVSYLIYFITSITENEINYVDCTGRIFTEVRYTGQKHKEIPDDYTIRK